MRLSERRGVLNVSRLAEGDVAGMVSDLGDRGRSERRLDLTADTHIS